ncbi:MAG: histidinol-phosphate aminotransferase family protein [Acidobacteria bacterium]|nr:histidinol-phosphate aminotransferase family protein [Acidobacteriota bacterium]
MSDRSQSSPVRFVRPELKKLKAYHLVQAPFRFKLDQNEVPWDLPRRLKRRVTRRLEAESWATYPDFNADELRKAIGERERWPWRGVLVGGGSSELLSLSVESMVPAGTEVLGHAPSFGLYSMLIPRSGAVPHFIQSGVDLQIPYDEILAEVERDPRRPLLLCTPNNPPGDGLTVEQVEALLERLDAPLMLDNAYDGFCRWDYRPLLDKHRHLLIYRTLSKAWAVAGMRIGYLLADPDLVDELVKAKLPYNLGHAAILTGLELLADPGFSDRAVRAILARRPQWVALLEEHGLETFPTETNFVLFRCGRGPDGQARSRVLLDGLTRRGILVRDVSAGPGLAGCLRVTVGGGGALRAMRQALEEIGDLGGEGT